MQVRRIWNISEFCAWTWLSSLRYITMTLPTHRIWSQAFLVRVTLSEPLAQTFPCACRRHAVLLLEPQWPSAACSYSFAWSSDFPPWPSKPSLTTSALPTTTRICHKLLYPQQSLSCVRTCCRFFPYRCLFCIQYPALHTMGSQINLFPLALAFIVSGCSVTKIFFPALLTI